MQIKFIAEPAKKRVSEIHKTLLPHPLHTPLPPLTSPTHAHDNNITNYTE